MQNTVPISSEAITHMCQYPLIKVRMDISFDEYIVYKNNWYTFNKIWAYNYTIRDLRERGGVQNYYKFQSDSERLSYRIGQATHSYMYSDAATTGAFNSIP